MKIFSNKLFSAFICLIMAISLFLTSCGENTESKKPAKADKETVNTEKPSEKDDVPKVEEEPEIEEEPEVEQKPEISPKPSNPTPAPKPTTPTLSGTFNPNPSAPSYGNFTPNQTLDIASNIFTDALVYTGYNLEKHNNSGLRWTYILASQKRNKGWLSKIRYGGGSTGYETTSDGKPDIAYFEKRGLVCASFVSYVYYNYLPNVAGIDTSMLAKPNDPKNAHDVYNAALNWVKSGYSELIPFQASISSGKRIKFRSSKDIPIGSVMVFCKTSQKNSSNPRGGHVAIYAGYSKNSEGEENHWVIHVGNDNGPEFCSVERMNADPRDPHWPLAVISAPKNIRFGAALKIDVKDDEGNAVSGVKIDLKDTKGKSYNLSQTNAEGVTSIEYLNYIDVVATLTLPDGYLCDATTQSIKLTSKNNSLNTISFILKKKPTENEEETDPENPDTEMTE